MLKSLLEDLRFIIGLFFALISLILLAASFIHQTSRYSSFNLNFIAACYTGFFAFCMFSFCFLNKRPPTQE